MFSALKLAEENGHDQIVEILSEAKEREDKEKAESKDSSCILS